MKEYLADFKVVSFVSNQNIAEKLKDGGLAIVDQWICAHAR